MNELPLTYDEIAQAPRTELVARAKSAEAVEFMALLATTVHQDEVAQLRARHARQTLNSLVAVGLSRPDVNNRRMAETTGIKERDLYKRKDRL